MKNKLIEILELKEKSLEEVYLMQTIATESQLKDLDKNEIELKAQISLLRHLLSEPENNNLTELIDRLEFASNLKYPSRQWNQDFKTIATNLWKNKEDELLKQVLRMEEELGVNLK